MHISCSSYKIILTTILLCFDDVAIIMLVYADILLDDFLIAENSSFQSERSVPITSPKVNHSNINSHATSPPLDVGPEFPSSGGMRYYCWHCFPNTLVISAHSNAFPEFDVCKNLMREIPSLQHGQKFLGETKRGFCC